MQGVAPLPLSISFTANAASVLKSYHKTHGCAEVFPIVLGSPYCLKVGAAKPCLIHIIYLLIDHNR